MFISPAFAQAVSPNDLPDLLWRAGEIIIVITGLLICIVFIGLALKEANAFTGLKRLGRWLLDGWLLDVMWLKQLGRWLLDVFNQYLDWRQRQNALRRPREAEWRQRQREAAFTQQVIIKTYRGSQAQATMLFQLDFIEMAAQRYFPTSQSWAPGQWAAGAFLIAVLLIFLFGLGLLILGYMLIVKPDGTLTVTYERRAASVEEKTCPRCAERIKAAALVCHFCGHEFAPGEVKKVEEQTPERQAGVYRGYTYIIGANGEAELELSSGAWRKFPSTEYLKAYVDAVTGNRS